MSVDLADLIPQWLAKHTRRTLNSSELIKHLRRNGEITRTLKLVIADILESKLKAKPKPTKWKDILTNVTLNGKIKRSAVLSVELEAYKLMLKNVHEKNWEETRRMLDEAGYRGTPISKGEITAAAKRLLCRRFKLTDSQLSGMLSPRTRDRKNR